MCAKCVVSNWAINSYALFSDAEIPEDVAEDFVGGDFTNDAAEVVDGFADVLGCEVCREAGDESVTDAE